MKATPQQTAAKPTKPAPGSPGAPDLVTHLLRDHGLGLFSDPPVRATRPDGLYDMSAMQYDHWRSTPLGEPTMSTTRMAANAADAP